MTKINNVRNVVILRTDRIGEVLLSTVAVDDIKKQYPDSKVSFVTSAYSRSLLDNREDLENVWEADTSGRKNMLLEAGRLAATLRPVKFDTAIVLNPHKMLHLACFFAGIPNRVGYDRKWGFLLNRKIKDLRDEGSKHETEYTRDLLRSVGIIPGTDGPSLTTGISAEKSLTNKLIADDILEKDKIIIVQPGSSNPAKRWPKDKYKELIKRINDELGIKSIVLGDKEEQQLVRSIMSGREKMAVSFAGKLDLKEVAALLKRSILFVGNDNGPMHMAAALGVPVIAIFGRNIPGVSPVRWRPWGKGHVVFHEDTGCEVCKDAACPYEYKCLDAVTVDAVFEVVKKMVNERV